MPEVSILTAAFNNGKYIEEMIESVLSQTFSDWELIIIDDGSTDDTKKKVGAYLNDSRINYVWQMNQGQAAARNRAYQLSKGKYIAILDSDDYWESTKLQKQMELLDIHPNVGLVYTNGFNIDEGGIKFEKQWVIKDISNDPLPELILINNPIYFSSVLFNRNYLDSYKLQEDSIKCSDELITLLRVALRSRRFAYIPEPLTFYRIHNSSKTFVEGISNTKIGLQQTLNLFFREPDIPRRIIKLKSKAYAKVFLSAAGRYNGQHIAPHKAIWNCILSIIYCPLLAKNASREIVRTLWLQIILPACKKR